MPSQLKKSQLCLFIPQSLSEEMSILRTRECKEIIKPYEKLSISPSMSMAVKLDEDEDPNEHIAHACPQYPDIHGPAIVEGSLTELKSLKNNHKKLGDVLSHDLYKRDQFQFHLTTMLGKNVIFQSSTKTFLQGP